jgi:hypothetical protein
MEKEKQIVELETGEAQEEDDDDGEAWQCGLAGARCRDYFC